MNDSAADPEGRWPAATDLAAQLVEASGEEVVAILLYGSHLLGTNPDQHSAVDFVVIVEDYRGFYAALAAAKELGRPVWMMTALAKVLPPNVLAFAPAEGQGGIAKYLLVSRADFERATGAAPPDHFLLGRIVQRVGIVWCADTPTAEWVRRRLAAAHEGVLTWMAPYLQGLVDAEGLGRRLLEVCYQGEFRPESAGRAARVFEAQADHFVDVFGPVLERAADAGRLVRQGAGYALATPVSDAETRKWRRHFRRSKFRTTARWLKHTVTFANWLPYIVRKVERHRGHPIHLTLLERKLPLIFLWPRAVHVLITRPRREIKS